MDGEGAVQSEGAALGYQGECRSAMEEYQPLGLRIQLQEEEEEEKGALCAASLESYWAVGTMEEERAGSSENLTAEAEDAVVQYRLLDDCEEGRKGGGEREGGGMEREACKDGDSSQFQITSSTSEPSSEGEGEEELEGEKTESGYMLLFQDEQTLEEEEAKEMEEEAEEEEEGVYKNDNLELQGYQAAGIRRSRMANWLQKQMEELNSGRGRGCERSGGGGGRRKGGACKGSERGGGCEESGGGWGKGEENNVGEGDSGWATFDDSATADSHNWPVSTYQWLPAHSPVEGGLVAPVSNMEDGMKR